MAYQNRAWHVRFVGLVESKEGGSHMLAQKRPGRVRLGWAGTIAIVAVGALLVPRGRGESTKFDSRAAADTLASLALPDGIAELFELNKDSILERFGEPNHIFYRDQQYKLDDLPEDYFMVYDDLSFGIHNGDVNGITLLDDKYVFGSGIRVGDRDVKIAATLGPRFTLEEHPVKDFLIYEDLGLSFEIYKPGRAAKEINIQRHYLDAVKTIAFGKKLAQRIARLDIDEADRIEVIRIFGEPEKYFGRNKTYREDQLPSWYVMVYPAGFSVVIQDDRVVEIRCRRPVMEWILACAQRL
jgi:hypothetical protein